MIHPGHNRWVEEVADAGLDEDVQGVAVSSYLGGQAEYFEYQVPEYFSYLVDPLRAQGGTTSTGSAAAVAVA